MSHQPNWQEYGKGGQDKDATQIHDARYGKFACNVKFPGDYKATANLPATPTPFTLASK